MTFLRSSAPRDRVLRAALQVFAEKGYHEATMDEVAQAAQVSKGALYLHFASKQALFAALLDSATVTLVEAMEQAMAGHTSHRARMRAAIQAAFELLQEHRTLARLVFLRMGSVNPLIERKIMEAHQRITALIEEQLRAACQSESLSSVDIPLLALMWTGAIYEVLVWWLYQEHPPALESLVEPLYTALLRTLGLDAEM